MESRRPPLFRKRQFEPVTIVTCVRSVAVPLSARDVEELIADRATGFAAARKARGHG